MAFKLTRDQRLQRDKLVSQLRKQAEEVAGAIASYNEILAEAQQFAQDVADGITDAMADKSDRWQEGDKAQEIQEWADQWTDLDTEEVDAPDLEHADALADIPSKPD